MNKAETNHSDHSGKHIDAPSTEEEQPPPSSQPHFWHAAKTQNTSPPSREQLPTSPRRQYHPKPISPLGAVNIVNMIDSIPLAQGSKRKKFTLESESPEKAGCFDDFEEERQSKKLRISHDDEDQLSQSAERQHKGEDILRINKKVIKESKRFRKKLKEMQDKMTSEEIDYVLG